MVSGLIKVIKVSLKVKLFEVVNMGLLTKKGWATGFVPGFGVLPSWIFIVPYWVLDIGLGCGVHGTGCGV
jgi:hypothetical protein